MIIIIVIIRIMRTSLLIKKFVSMHESICSQRNGMLRTASSASWLTSGRTVLILKDPTKGNIPANY